MTNVLISGASVAGPALAYWLRNYGFDVTVVERAPAPRGGGQAIDLRGTARQVAERMGIMPEVRRAHTGAHGMAVVDRTGKRLASMGADLLGDSGGVIADLEILRGDLVRILHEATSDGVEYVFDDSIAELAQDGEGVKVTFERAAPRRFDLVVGADGLHSTARRLAFGPETRFVRDLGAYVSIFSTTTREDLDGWELMYRIPGRDGVRGRTAALYPTGRSGDAKGMFVFAAPALRYDRGDPEQQKRLVADAFAGAGWEVPRLLESMWVSQIHLDRWSTGRVVLLGDAGYCGSPMAGNGTSMALVGAYVLAGELSVAEDHVAAFANYEEQMRRYVDRCQKFAKGGAGFLLPKSRAQAWLYCQSIRMLPYMPWRGVIGAGLQKTANAVTLRDYPAS
jgi:2-polyprenyl-6-methoxyphenol hydroxylase-like FAD-dependent oxidoreductase